MTQGSEYEKRLMLLEKKLCREKKARQLAEQQLEEYSRKIYLTNQSLTESLEHARKKQRELVFLKEVTAIVTSDLSIGELLGKAVSLAGQFFNARCGHFFYTSDGALIQEHKNQTWFQQAGWQLDEALSEAVLNLLPFEYDEDYEHWLVSPLEEADIKVSLTSFNWMVYVNFKLLDDRVVWMVLLSDDDFLDEESLYVLDTAKDSFVSGIRRRLGELQVRQRNAQLQKTIRQLEQTRQQLVQSEKMASLGQLAAGVAHEINNPVSFIRSNTEILVEYLSDFDGFVKKLNGVSQEFGKVTVEEFQKIQQSLDLRFVSEDTHSVLDANLEGLDRISDIIESLRTFSHAGEKEFTPVSLADCIENALKVTANALKYEYQVHNSLDSKLPTIIGDMGQLQQVFVNLLINATHAMPEGGDIYIDSDVQDGNVKITVKDNGAGMDDKTLRQLFTPFFTTKPVGVGTGLGLSVSFAILEAHNATINVESEVGKGSTFAILFPLP